MVVAGRFTLGIGSVSLLNERLGGDIVRSSDAFPPHPLRHGRRRRRAAFALVLALALLASTVSAGAQSAGPAVDNTRSPDAGPTTASSAEQSTDPAAVSYASEYGVTEAEAARRLDRIQPMQEVLASIRKLESSRVAGWGIDHADSFTGWVWLTGADPAIAAAKAIADAHSDIEIRTGAKHTLTQLLAAQDRFGNGSSIGPVGRVDDQTPIADYSAAVTFTAPDMDTNTLHIGIDPALLRPAEPTELQGPGGGTGPVGSTGAPTAPDSATDAELAALAAQMTAAYHGRMTVAYAIVDGRDHADLAMFDGGRAMSTCTSGFAARQHSTGDYGIITAGHCSASQAMHSVSLPWVTGYKGTTADAQFHSIPSGSGHQLRSDYLCRQYRLNVCTVHGDVAISQMYADWVCHTGKNTGTTCGRVDYIYFRPTGSNACLDSEFGAPVQCAARFVRVHSSSLKGCLGDSGGPWFRRNTAYGILKGGTDRDDCVSANKSLWFSAIREVETFLGVDVLVNNNVTIG